MESFVCQPIGSTSQHSRSFQNVIEASWRLMRARARRLKAAQQQEKSRQTRGYGSAGEEHQIGGRSASLNLFRATRAAR